MFSLKIDNVGLFNFQRSRGNRVPANGLTTVWKRRRGETSKCWKTMRLNAILGTRTTACPPSDSPRDAAGDTPKSADRAQIEKALISL